MSTYSILLLTHRIVVTLFFLQYVIKLALLLMNNNETLDKYSKTTRIPESVVSVLFLVTGVWMIATGALVSTLMIIKLLCIIAAIPLAIVGFKRRNKMLAILSVLLITGAYGLAEVNKKHKGEINTTSTSTDNSSDPIAIGQKFYAGSCANCHGADGKLGGSGAKDLSATQLTADQQKDLIRHGKGAMPEYPVQALSNEQLNDVVMYVATLKK
jgi:uncharacterized membrane protein SirB2